MAINIAEFREFIKDKTAKKKIRFIGHEGVSAFKSVDILNKSDLSEADKIKIFKLVSVHGDLFNYIKSDGTIKEKDIIKRFTGEKWLLENLLEQVRADTTGRFNISDTRADTDFCLDLPTAFKNVVTKLENSINKANTDNQPSLTILVGPPCSRKTTWVEKNIDNSTIVISRDKLVEEVGKKYGCETYSESFRFLQNNAEIESKEVKQQIELSVQEARRNNKDVVIDMTNMSKKSRRRWISTFAKYHKRCIVFVTGYNELKDCNVIRAQKTGKEILETVLLSMCKRFSVPLYGEGFDSIDYIWN